MLCVVVLEVEDGDFSDLKGSALDVKIAVFNLKNDNTQHLIFLLLNENICTKLVR